jgi:hypothetical protein
MGRCEKQRPRAAAAHAQQHLGYRRCVAIGDDRCGEQAPASLAHSRAYSNSDSKRPL